MDNAPSLTDKIHLHTTSWHNQDMKDWVKSNNQTVDPSGVKTELLTPVMVVLKFILSTNMRRTMATSLQDCHLVTVT
jgi:hypothetical protein